MHWSGERAERIALQSSHSFQRNGSVGGVWLLQLDRRFPPERSSKNAFNKQQEQTPRHLPHLEFGAGLTTCKLCCSSGSGSDSQRPLIDMPPLLRQRPQKRQRHKSSDGAPPMEDKRRRRQLELPRPPSSPAGKEAVRLPSKRASLGLVVRGENANWRLSCRSKRFS